MIRKEKDRVVWLEFELLQPFSNLSHGVFLRHGGESLESYSSLNLGFNLNNEKENQNVHKNRVKIKEIFSIDHLNDCRLEHSDKIVEITPLNNGTRPDCDGIKTNHKKMALMVTHADCQAAIFYDPIKKCIAVVHAGWRGNVLNIYGKTIESMKERYHSRPEDIHVCISPSLGPESAEFIHYKQELPESFWNYQIKPFYFDLWQIAEDQLKNSGILPHHLQIARIDTVKNPEDYFSYRREKLSGRHGTFAEII